MIVNPIIPNWLMSIISLGGIILVIFSKPINLKKGNKIILNKKYVLNLLIKFLIIGLLFIINLRFMLPNGEAISINSNIEILFVIDNSVSMRALDYNGDKERFEGVINDCCYIVNKLPNCKFSIITFNDKANKVAPFTPDTNMIQAELKAISIERDLYAKGSSMNTVKEMLEKTIKEQKTKNEESKIVVFFISDGEITIEGEKLESFSNISNYIYNGTVMGYGTTEGGKMINSLYKDNPNSPSYFINYFDEDYNRVTAISKLDENNLKQIAKDMGIEYIRMEKKSNIDKKIDEINKEIINSQSSEEKVSYYKDIYYYFAIPLVILLIVDFVIKKRRM